ncbi:hypothetical protein PUR71_30270 [Streptomyces sp. SP17BM10]|uniref:hypothetical protein n=1 Tax=Streptomyces sp. SP17BM10 TaxID=3002530 RepID=UPI002E761F91|nr:hypothetical protein [Streptomyces sp. SP17BM10]MEE1787160.1 hypothetical protein [Streptomyces sp. SP17BM10]
MRLASAVVTAAVLVGGVTACGSSGKSVADTKGGDTKAAGDAVAGALAGDPKAALAASALVMQKAGNGKVAMVAPDGSTHTAGSGDADWKDAGKTAVDLTGEMDTKKMRIRVVGADVYLGGGEAEAAVLGGKHWVKMPPGNEMGSSILLMSQMLNPVVQLTLAAANKPTKVGQEAVDGTPATHIRAVEDVSTMVAGMTGLSPEQRQAVQKSLEQDGKKITVDLWLDAKQQLVQFQEFGDKNGEHDAVTVKYTGLGTAAKFEAPAATDLGNPADILKLLG